MFLPPRALRPDTHVFDSPDGTIRWRGARINSITGGTALIELHLEQHIIGTRTISTSLLPAGAIVGNPLVVRVTGTGASDYVIAEARGSRFGNGAPSDQAGAVARGQFWPGVITRAEDPNRTQSYGGD
jgi:hypothetical protein